MKQTQDALSLIYLNGLADFLPGSQQDRKEYIKLKQEQYK